MTVFTEDRNDRPLARAEGILAERVGQDLVIYDESRATAHSLSADATRVWERCDGQLSRADIASKLRMDPGTVERAIREFREAGLLVERDGLTRRQVSKRLAAVGGVAFAAPLLYSVPVASATPGCSISALCDQTITSHDWNNPNSVDDFVFFAAVIHTTSTTAIQVVLQGSTITIPGCTGSPGDLVISVPNAVVTTGSTSPFPSNPYYDGTTWHTFAPTGNEYMFLTAVYIDRNTAVTPTEITDKTATCGKVLNWDFPLTGTVSAVVDWAWRSEAFAETGAGFPFPGYNNLAITPYSTSQAAAGVPTFETRDDGGSNGSMTGNASCTFACT